GAVRGDVRALPRAARAPRAGRRQPGGGDPGAGPRAPQVPPDPRRPPGAADRGGARRRLLVLLRLGGLLERERRGERRLRLGRSAPPRIRAGRPVSRAGTVPINKVESSAAQRGSGRGLPAEPGPRGCHGTGNGEAAWNDAFSDWRT